MSDSNVAWNLAAFLDSLIYELDRATQVLAIKQDNVKLTYTVQDLSVSLQVFPQYDGDRIRFVTAQPGQDGASNMSFQLGSIRDTQIREIARRIPTMDDVPLDELELPESERATLRRLGINTAEDLRRTVEDKRVDIEQVTDRKVSYRNLAEIINRTHRMQRQAPRVRGVSLSTPTDAGPDVLLTVRGENLSIEKNTSDDGQRSLFPLALLDGAPLSVVSASEDAIHIALPSDKVEQLAGSLTLALDPYAVLTMDLTDQSPTEAPIDDEKG